MLWRTIHLRVGCHGERNLCCHVVRAHRFLPPLSSSDLLSSLPGASLLPRRSPASATPMAPLPTRTAPSPTQQGRLQRQRLQHRHRPPILTPMARSPIPTAPSPIPPVPIGQSVKASQHPRPRLLETKLPPLHPLLPLPLSVHRHLHRSSASFPAVPLFVSSLRKLSAQAGTSREIASVALFRNPFASTAKSSSTKAPRSPALWPHPRKRGASKVRAILLSNSPLLAVCASAPLNMKRSLKARVSAPEL